MARGDQLSRQWKIIQALISSKIGKSAAQIAEQLECHQRTIYRDLQALQAAGFPIYTEREDGKSLWRLLENARRPIPLPLSLPELMAIHFSRDMLKVFTGTPFYDSLESLFHKVQATLPEESKTFLASIEHTFHFGIKPRKNYGAFKEIIERVTDAVVKRKSIEVLYYTMSRKQESLRKIDPYRVWFFNGTFYLIGFCHMRAEVRVFVLDRIKALNETLDSFEVSADFQFDKFVRWSFGVFQGKPLRVKVWFSPDVAGYIEENIWHGDQKIRQQEDGAVVFEAQVAGAEEIKHWIMGWGANAVVLEPEALRDEIKQEAERVLQRYET
ncbi:MAG: transcriptional regulator [Desulfoferrobacter sp.]